MKRSALISPNGLYRYWLERDWNASRANRGFVLWLMLNPSTADAVDDDATIRKCVGFTDRWGYGRLRVGNLFAFRATAPKDLLWAADPVGPDNDEHLRQMIAEAAIVVVGWGDSGPPTLVPARAEFVRQLVVQAKKVAWCIGKTAVGTPRHPSRPGYKSVVEAWS